MRARVLSVFGFVAFGLTAVATFAGCSKRAEDTSPSARPAPAPTMSTPKPPMADPDPAAAKAGALRWSDPPSWTKEAPSNGMRAAQYKIAHTGSDSDDAICVVTTFGAGEGGSVDQNVDRWVRQFDPSGSGPIDKSTQDVDGMKITIVKVTGAYKGMSMPGTPAGPAKANQRLVGAIVEAPSGLWFFKMTGPEATVKSSEPAFATMMASLKKG